MSDLQIVFTPSQKLREVSNKVEDSEFGEELEKHMCNMLETMYKLNGAGLAGVQVGDARRILVIDSREGDGPIMMVNPEFTNRSEDSVMFEEGCLSFPGLSVGVKRHASVGVKYNLPNGEAEEKEFSGAESVIVQHEIDHLDGVTLLSKISKLKRDMYKRKIRKYRRKIERKLKQASSLYY